MKARYGALILLSLVGLIGLLELAARTLVGLGDPPLYSRHPTVGYMLSPNQECRPFGNRVVVNAFGMRSDAFPATKARPDELRILAFGDSVLNGGALTDQEELATHRAAAALSTRLQRPVVIGNVSSGGWDPVNWLAYVDAFGVFDADVVLLVVNARDAVHVPPAGAGSGRPTHRPPLALIDGLRYLRYERAPGRPLRATRVSALPALDALLTRLAQSSAVAVLVHPLRRELESRERAPGTLGIRSLVQAHGLPVVDLGPFYGDVPPEALYRDAIHPTALAQERMARAIAEVVAELAPAPDATN